MANELKTLLIVEGEYLEPAFYKQLKKVFGLNLDIYCLKSNIYLLYRKMKEIGFNGNLKDVLLEMQNSEKNRELLSQNFAYTYLIFDFDPHHTEEYEKNVPLEDIVVKNIAKVQEMAEYFVDETDPTIGKLYINYPMMESFKDCDSFTDNEYLKRFVNLEDIKQYKAIVGKRKMANKRIDSYSTSDFTQIASQNVKKLKEISVLVTDIMDYESYLKTSVQTKILQQEIEFVQLLRKVAVLNTSIFFIVDYYGNKNGFFDTIMENK